jgi:pimeloyl-ACP methyl ester carboxylesterase
VRSAVGPADIDTSVSEAMFRSTSTDWLLAAVAAALVAVSLWQLGSGTAGLTITTGTVGATPVTVYEPADAPPGPPVVIAHGFAGSEKLMRSFALTLAQNGYTAITFDFLGHGRHPQPIRGDVRTGKGVMDAMIAQIGEVAAFARAHTSEERIAVIGHSMASDLVVRFAQAEGDAVRAVVAVSMFAPTLDATSPNNLLVIVGNLEAQALKDEALRAVALAADGPVAEGVTVGDFAAGTARRAFFAPGAEHVAVLYSSGGLLETVRWLDEAFARTSPVKVVGQGLWILLLFLGLVLLAKPGSHLLPVVTAEPRGAGLPWRRLWLAALLPAVLTPVILRFVPTDMLPLLLGDYLVTHFALYGLLTWAALSLLAPAATANALAAGPVHYGRLALAALAVLLYAVFVVGLSIDRFVTIFMPIPERLPLVAAMLLGTLPYFLADEWLTRGKTAARGAYPVTKLAFLLSLALAITLDFERLFFLAMIVPIILAFFVVYGLFSAWAFRRTNHPFTAGLANAVAFAIAIAVTFPMVVD